MTPRARAGAARPEQFPMRVTILDHDAVSLIGSKLLCFNG
jgi:hypothetical protein